MPPARPAIPPPPPRLHDLHWTWRDTLLTLASAALPLLAIAAG